MNASIEDRTFREIKRLCCAGLGYETLAERLVGGLRRAVPFDSYGVSSLDPLSGLPNHVIPGGGMGDNEEDAFFFMKHIYFDDEVTDITWLAKSRLGAMRLTEATGGKLERALRHREFNVHKGFANEMRCAFTAGGELWGGICLIREKGARDFDEREVAFLKRLSPHLALAFRAATLAKMSREDEAHEDEFGGDAPGVVVLDDAGRVEQYTPAARAWLADLGADDESGKWREGRGLPLVLWAVAGAMRRALDPEPRYVPRVCAQGASGRWLTLQASRGEASPETVVVIAPAGPLETMRLGKAAYGLTPREEEVSDLVIRGWTTRDISRSLHISEYTVQDHLKKVFGKVGVKSRRELLKRLFLDTVSLGS